MIQANTCPRMRCLTTHDQWADYVACRHPMGRVAHNNFEMIDRNPYMGAIADARRVPRLWTAAYGSSPSASAAPLLAIRKFGKAIRKKWLFGYTFEDH